jgi:hypothetical protein
MWPQDTTADIGDLPEARHYLLSAPDAGPLSSHEAAPMALAWNFSADAFDSKAYAH